MSPDRHLPAKAPRNSRFYERLNSRLWVWLLDCGAAASVNGRISPAGPRERSRPLAADRRVVTVYGPVFLSGHAPSEQIVPVADYCRKGRNR